MVEIYLTTRLGSKTILGGELKQLLSAVFPLSTNNKFCPGETVTCTLDNKL
uniref:Uncharacterized protein n=1 Tax=Anguilla anguilla TaxID=7936 RepID=A0A0E9WEF2_ANGAN